MAAVIVAYDGGRGDLSSSAGIEQHMRSREELAEQVALLRLGHAAAAAEGLARTGADSPTVTPEADQDGPLEETLLERFERVTGQPLAQACPPWCSCRGPLAGKLVGTR